jgi:hypothetical protein
VVMLQSLFGDVAIGVCKCWMLHANRGGGEGS